MIHLKNSGYLPQDASALLTRADQLSSELDAIIRDTRISSRYLEFDISIDKEQLDTLAEKLEPLGKLESARLIVDEKMDKEEAIEKAISYFNNERFWECHEVLEGVWKKTYGDEKDLVQGIILVAAALVHYQKNEKEICLSILKRATEKLDSDMEKYYEIDLDVFRNKISEMIKSTKIEPFAI